MDFHHSRPQCLRVALGSRLDFHCSVNCTLRTHVNEIDAMNGRSRANVQVEPRSTFTFTRNLSYITSISFTHVNFACVLTEKLRDSGNHPWHGSQRLIATQVRISCVEAAVWVRHLQLSCDTTRDRLDIWTWTSVDLLYLQYVYIYKSLFYFKKSLIGGGSLNCTGYKLIYRREFCNL